MQRCNLTVSLRGDQAVSGHRPPHMVSVLQHWPPGIQRTRAGMKLGFSEVRLRRWVGILSANSPEKFTFALPSIDPKLGQ